MGPALARPGGWVLTPDVSCLPELPKPGEGWALNFLGLWLEGGGQGKVGKERGFPPSPSVRLFICSFIWLLTSLSEFCSLCLLMPPSSLLEWMLFYPHCTDV